MTKLIIILSTITAHASYDVSFITVNGKPTVEIVKNDRICQVSFEKEEIAKLSSDQIAAKAWEICRSK